MAVTTDQCYKLRVSLLRTATEKHWGSGTSKWSISGREEARLSFLLKSHEGRPMLFYQWGEWELGSPSYGVPYEVVPANVGGVRRFWHCHCGRRVTVIFCPKGNVGHPNYTALFACRHCYGLRYASQYESPTDRNWRRCGDLFEEWLDRTTPLPRWETLTERLQTFSPFFRKLTDRTEDNLAQKDQQSAVSPRRRGRPSPKRERADARVARAAELAARPKRPPGRPKEKRPYVRHEPIVLSARTGEPQAYCPKCRDRRPMRKGEAVVFRNGRHALQGTCRACGTRMARIVSASTRAE
jgi:Domain of unknown function (DUF5679)